MPSYPLPSCPATIVGPNANGFSLEPKKAKEGMRTEMGSTRMRRFNTPNVYVISVEFNFFTPAKFAEFLTWLKYETNYGNLWFKADWFSDLGFTAGEWVFRFVELPFSNTGYSQSHQATLLMGPYNDNVVSGNYTELGIGGEFIDQDFPFGYEEFQCSDLTYKRVTRYNGQTVRMQTHDFNDSNWTPIGNGFNVSTPWSNNRSLASMRENYVALLNTVTAGFIPTLRMFKFDGVDFTQQGTGTGFFGIISETSKICRLSDTRVALYETFDKTLRVFEFNYSTNIWIQIGTPFSLATYVTGVASITNDLTCMGNNRVAFVYHEAEGALNHIAKLVAFDFNTGTLTWSQVGSKFTIYNDAVAGGEFFSISAMSLNSIVLTQDITSGAGTKTYEKRLTKFTFGGATWSVGTPSAIFPNGGVPKVAMITPTRVAVSRTDGAVFGVVTFEHGGNVDSWTQVGNYTPVETVAISTTLISSFFLPE